MKRIASHLVGVDSGSVLLFSDFEHDGEMWKGTGERAARRRVGFSGRFRAVPVVTVSISMWDLDQKTNQRADIAAEAVTVDGFDLVFRTWGDTRVARIRADWLAIGEVDNPEDADWALT